eukprot:4544829-Karenia_brevis.AAC.1
MKNLWEARPDSCDVCLTASGGEAVRTHASVVVGASPVFAAMLTSACLLIISLASPSKSSSSSSSSSSPSASSSSSSSSS